jgi:Uma2 family endonuclease
MTSATNAVVTPHKIRKIPQRLVREVVGGRPFYYKGYKSVMNGTKKLEEIMGCSSLQAIIVSILDFFVKSNINRKLYWTATNEAGLHLGHKNNLSTDLGIFLKEKVVLNEKYFEVAPEIAIEVDVKVDTDRELDYVFSKAEELMSFGTEKVCWIITQKRKIFVFAKGQTTTVVEWHQDIELMDGIKLNLQKLLEEEGVNY